MSNLSQAIAKSLEKLEKLEDGGQKHHSQCPDNIYPCLKCMQKSIITSSYHSILRAIQEDEQKRKKIKFDIGRVDKNDDCIGCGRNWQDCQCYGYNQAKDETTTYIQSILDKKI